jgi:hypothetical protein
LLVLACFSRNMKSQKQKQRRCTDNSNWFHEYSPLPRIRPRAILRIWRETSCRSLVLFLESQP